MSTIENKSENLPLLERIIKKEMKIIVVDSSQYDIFMKLHSAINEKDLKDFEIWHCFDSIPNSPGIIQVSVQEMCKIMELYRLFDFSDRIIVVSPSIQYGSIYNFMQIELLSENEMVNALLHI